MTEIAFLLDLVLNHKMSKDAKERCIKRIAEVEARLTPQPYARPAIVTAQAPSTQALLDAQAAALSNVAQTPAVAAALQSRAEAIANAGKVEPGKTGPRKF